MAKYCANCGKELTDEQDICLNCGVRVKKGSTSSDPNAKSKLAAGLFGIFGGQKHRHEPTIQLRVLFHICQLTTGGGKIHQQLFADVGMGHFSAPEPHRNLHPVAIIQKLHGIFHLGV